MTLSIKALSIKAFLLRRGAIRRAWRSVRPSPLGPESNFLKRCRQIVHVGANNGAERQLYESLGLDVTWVEPIPHVFDELTRNILGYKNQRAIRALLGNMSGQKLFLNVANNNGESSSIYPIADHAKIWPEVHFADKIELEMTTLDEIISGEQEVDALVVDTQGSELIVLQGGEGLISRLKFIKVEAADFPAYEGGCKLNEIETFLAYRGFVEISRKEIASKSGVGRYYDVVFENFR